MPTVSLLVILQDVNCISGFGGEICALVGKSLSRHQSTVKLVAAPDIPLPFSPLLEQVYLPNEGQLIEAVKDDMRA